MTARVTDPASWCFLNRLLGPDELRQIPAAGLTDREGCFLYEAGHAETVEGYRAGYLAADLRVASATDREVSEEQVLELGNAVLYLSESPVRGAVSEREVDSRGVETMVLTRDDDGWRLCHIHWSNR